MALNIVPSAEVGEENPLVTIFGEPDAGKTSLAYTACERNRLLLIDFDGKAQRSLRVGDEPTAQVTSWEDVQGVAPSDLDGFHVVVLDSVTEAIEKAKRHILKGSPGSRTKNGEIVFEHAEEPRRRRRLTEDYDGRDSKVIPTYWS